MATLLTDKQLETYESAVFNHIQQHCIYRARVRYGEPHLVRWNNGDPQQDATYQFFMMRALMDFHISNMIGRMFWEKMHKLFEETPFQIAGAESSGIPLVSAILTAGFDLDYETSGFIVRKEQKKYGFKNWTEGMINPELPILLVDDIVNSGRSLDQCDVVCTELGYQTLDDRFCVLAWDNMKNLHWLFRRGHFSLKFGDKWDERTYDNSMNLAIQFGEDCTCGAPTPEECPGEWERLQAEKTDE